MLVPGPIFELEGMNTLIGQAALTSEPGARRGWACQTSQPEGRGGWAPSRVGTRSCSVDLGDPASPLPSRAPCVLQQAPDRLDSDVYAFKNAKEKMFKVAAFP